MSTIQLTLLAETQAIRKGIDDTNAQLNNFGKTAGKVGGLMKTAFVAAGAAVAGAQIGAFLKDSIVAASDLNETVSKTNQIFGDAAPAILKFSETAATRLGQTKQQALDASTTFATFGKSAGLAGGDLAKFAKQNTVLASDLASFHNTSPEEAIQAIGAAFRGEAEPLRRYGVLLDDASLRQEAMRQGIVKTTSQALTPQQKVLAAQALIMKQTGDAQGDFARTSGGLANQQRILSAQFENLKTTIGTKLLPVALRLVTWANDSLIPALKKAWSAVQPLISAIGRFTSSLGNSQGRLSGVSSFIKSRVIPAIKGIGDAYRDFWNAARPIITQLVATIKSKWGQIGPQVKSIFNNVKSIITSALSIMQSSIRTVTKVMTAIWSRFGDIIRKFTGNTFKNVVTVISGAFKIIAGIFKTISAAMRGDWSGAWSGIKQIASGAVQVVRGIMSQFVNMVKTAIATFGRILGSIKNAVMGAVSGAGSWLLNAGRDIIDGLIDGINSMIGSVRNKLSELTNMIPKWKGPRAKDRKLLRPVGRLIMQGLVKGFDDGKKGVKKSLGDITEDLAKLLKNRGIKTGQLRNATKNLGRAFRDNERAYVKHAANLRSVTKRLAAAQEQLADLQKNRADYAASVASSAISSSAITSLDAAFNAPAMLSAMQSRVDKLRQFQTVLSDLIAKGLNSTMVDQLTSAGVEGGLAYALAIQQGGTTAVSDFNALQSQTNTLAANLGNTTANSMYGAGIKAADGLIQGLEKQAAKLDKVAQRFANGLIKAVKKALGIKSPSRVFADLGRQTLAGMEIGLSNTDGVTKAVTNVAKAMTTTFDPTLSATASPSAGSGRGETHIHFDIHPTSRSAAQQGQEILAYVEAALRQKNQRLRLERV